MAKGKKSSGQHYTSKGERRNVSAWLTKATRRDRKENPSVKSMLQRAAHRQLVMNSPKSPKEKELAARYAEQDRVESQAFQLLEQYREAGLTRAEAIMAVKTSHLERLHSKWTPILQQKKAAAMKGRK